MTFSLTDHDTIDGCAAIQKHLPPELEFFPGVEFSCRSALQKCHILGYDYDPEHPALLAALNEGSMRRRNNLERRLEYLHTVHGISFPQSDLDRLRAHSCVGKPHLARLMISMGIAPNIDTAIQQYINGCRAGNDRIDAGTAIRAITSAGGIPVWAHPLGGEGSRHLTPQEFYPRLDELNALGIRGLECNYSRYSGEEIAFLRSVAEQRGLLISGGSDYHGAVKTIRIGELSTDGTPVHPEQLTLLAELRRRRT